MKISERVDRVCYTVCVNKYGWCETLCISMVGYDIACMSTYEYGIKYVARNGCVDSVVIVTSERCRKAGSSDGHDTTNPS